jgi:N-acetylmuramoyl-L-alanine amidase
MIVKRYIVPMRKIGLKGIIGIIIAATSILHSSSLLSSHKSLYTLKPQPAAIRVLLQKEKSIEHTKNIINIIIHVDEVYANLYQDLLAGKRITIFFDPAHGKLKNGEWQGDVTGRISCTGHPEEYYSILISRQLYRILTANRFLDVKSTEDFLSVMKGESSTYKNIPFSETVELAKKKKAFIIISEHLNNIATIYKASGTINLPGIHITYGKWGRKYLIHIKNTYRGFLTLYNKLDTTGFSKYYALKLKEMLVSRGLKANNWEFGSVADDRFSYFVDFPVSVIFECGFISNPEEESNLRDPEYQRRLAESQYRSFLESIENIFGIDLSGSKPERVNNGSNYCTTLLKLSRIALYYIQNNELQNGISIINDMKRIYGRSKYHKYLSPYLKIKKLLTDVNNKFAQGKKLIKSKKHLKGKRRKKYWRRYRRGRRLIRQAFGQLKNKSLFHSIRKHYEAKYRGLIGYRTQRKASFIKRGKKAGAGKGYPSSIRTASWRTPIILPIEDGQSLEDAIRKALMPDEKKLGELVKSFREARIVKWKQFRRYSKKRKKRIYYWKKVTRNVIFTNGIYIVRLNKRLVVTSAKRVKKVSLNHLRYQNHQYLKNSYFAFKEKQRSL